MTLILTGLFPFGIVMGADSAYTQKVTDNLGRTRLRILTGLRKVYEIPKIKAGISCWGKGIIENGTCITDVWLSDFIKSREDQYDTTHAFAILLQERALLLCFRICMSGVRLERLKCSAIFSRLSPSST